MLEWCALIIMALSFWVGWWRARAELVGDGDFNVVSQSVCRLDDQGTLHVTFSFVAKTRGGFVITAEPVTHRVDCSRLVGPRP